ARAQPRAADAGLRIGSATRARTRASFRVASGLGTARSPLTSNTSSTCPIWLTKNRLRSSESSTRINRSCSSRVRASGRMYGRDPTCAQSGSGNDRAICRHSSPVGQVKKATPRPRAGSSACSALDPLQLFRQLLALALVGNRPQRRGNEVLEDDAPGAADPPVGSQLQIETDHRRRRRFEFGQLPQMLRRQYPIGRVTGRSPCLAQLVEDLVPHLEREALVLVDPQ